MSAHAASADARPRPSRARLRARALSRRAVASGTPTTVALAALVVAVVFEARGGLQLQTATRVEVGADLLAGLAGAAALLAGARSRRSWGLGTLAAFALLAVLTALSVLWAVNPGGAWEEANRTIAHVAVLALGLALVRLVPDRWASLLGAVVLASVVICGYALLSKVFPSALAHDEVYARLREPFGYWNAVGLMAAMGVPGCVWLGSRRTGHGFLTALAFPALGLLLVALLLAYSRGSLLALGVGLALWFAAVPLRLRGVAVLATSAAGAVPVALWAFGQPGLSEDRAGLAERTAAGWEFGLVLLALAGVLLAAGLVVGFATAARAPRPSARRQAGVAVLVVVGLVPVVVLTGLALSERGLGGSISKGWKDLTDPSARVTNDAQRLTALGSVRAQYWDEALQVYREDKLLGAGADGYATARQRYRRGILDVRHAHGYAVQTLADLGAVGLAVSLALLAAFLAAAGRTTGLWGPARRTAQTPERIGLVTLLSVVVVFGVHSLVDWTWFVPGTAMLALLCAGWVAGRGPVSEPVALPVGRLPDRLRRGARDGGRALLAAGAVLLAVVAAWQTLQPQRADATAGRALDALAAGHVDEARRLATTADDQDPLAVDALFDLAVVETTAGHPAVARGVLVRAVRRQPSNPDTWLRLADFEVSRDPKAALRAVGAALYLDPRSPEGQRLFLQATRAQGKAPDVASLPGSGQPAAPGSGGNPAVTTDGTTTTPAP